MTRRWNALKKNIYFVQVNDVYGEGEKTTYFPYAVGCIQAYCMQNEVITDNYSFKKIIYSRRPIQNVLGEFDNPYMVLFSCSVWNMEYNKVLASSVKNAFPNCYIVFGGHSVPPDGTVLEKYSYIDFLTHRFGEEPTEGLLVSLATNSCISKVTNISYRDANGHIHTTDYEAQTGSDYPSPYLNGVFDELMKDDIKFSALFETNRGCPNSCSFCDWSSLKSKVRLFPMERVIAEIDWFTEHKIEYIFCADGNFCLFDRDAEIADYLVECKEKYGYPKLFKALFTKNRFNFVFDVCSKFFRSGLDKAKTISFQSMNDEVLKNIGRKNISTEKYRELIKKYNALNISTFSELILGLPGETYQSFCKGVCDLIESGQHYSINIYPCELLPNAEMGKKAYQDRFGIKSTRVPFSLIHSNRGYSKDDIVEYSEYITSTSSMDEKEWAKALLFSSYIQALHNLGLLRAVAIYLRHEIDVDYVEFYNSLIEYSEKESSCVLNKVFNRISSLCNGVIERKNGLVDVCEGLGEMWWSFDELTFFEFYKDLKAFYDEVKVFVFSKYTKDEIVSDLFEYQYDIIKKVGKTAEISIMNSYNFYSYFNKIFKGDYENLRKERTQLLICDRMPVESFSDLAREAIWYGRNRRVSDYTSNNYDIKVVTVND